MKQVPRLFREKERTYSFELFPPKTEQGHEKLLSTLEELAALEPDFISCTYGAGGGNRAKTFDIVQHIQEKHGIPGVAHLTCVCHTKEEIRQILKDIKSRGICNILALRGDPPKDNPKWLPGEKNFKYSGELCAFIRQNFDDSFGIGVAGFPEGHPMAPDKNTDAQYLKMKMENGADYVITQLFFNNLDYFEYITRLKIAGVETRVIPGILPITDYKGLIRFCTACGTTIPETIKEIFEPIQDDKEKVLEEGIKFAIRQCQILLDGGAPGLHFYTLNKVQPVATILKEVRK